MDLISLRHALAVAEQTSFRRAGLSLGIDASAVSRRVRNLEDELGVSLFERHVRGVRTTVAGRRFLDQTRLTLADLDYAIKVAGNAGRGTQGDLRIGIFSSVASMFIRELLAEYAKRHPLVDIDVAEGAPSDNIRLVREGRLDAAFVTGVPNEPPCDSEQFWSERVFVVLPEGHALSTAAEILWEMLRTEHFIVSRDEPGPEIHDYVIRHLAELGHRPSVTRYAVGRENLMHLVGLGFGLSLTSEATIATVYPNVLFRPISGLDDNLPFSAVWLPSNDNPALRRLISSARALSHRAPKT
ncbi:MAG: LysR substrate-binding domain-containing protein [Methylocella sp.]